MLTTISSKVIKTKTMTTKLNQPALSLWLAGPTLFILLLAFGDLKVYYQLPAHIGTVSFLQLCVCTVLPLLIWGYIYWLVDNYSLIKSLTWLHVFITIMTTFLGGILMISDKLEILEGAYVVNYSCLVDTSKCVTLTHSILDWLFALYVLAQGLLVVNLWLSIGRG